ncbi:AN1-type zinc finger protein 2A [Toxorhynchites rutilus septentrionalis]|uniref:AN1-type zinc finger protein 2A n=1 Tax=Toxorhynchites rutilus septentrionalis TaxID=329112 RepID=UPI00247AE002|nr:AN1-type zinc finger protein 2A [Toxorhynchites rutilus septentrionalis]
MEFPNLGKHCSDKFCHKLDFLPMKCDACGEIFCSEHFSYQTHSCPSAFKKDVQVPICPLCGEPIPTPRDVPPDVTVGAHIDQYCRSEKKKIYTNHCTYKNCKKKELIPVSCAICKQNFCLRHRHTTDHECKGTISSQRHLAEQAAIQRQRPSATNNTNSSRNASDNLLATVQGNMSEDEALARALALSLQQEEDETTRAAARDNNGENGRNANRSGIPVGGNNAKDKCRLS